MEHNEEIKDIIRNIAINSKEILEVSFGGSISNRVDYYCEAGNFLVISHVE